MLYVVSSVNCCFQHLTNKPYYVIHAMRVSRHPIHTILLFLLLILSADFELNVACTLQIARHLSNYLEPEISLNGEDVQLVVSTKFFVIHANTGDHNAQVTFPLWFFVCFPRLCLV